METLVIAGARVWTDDGLGAIRFEPRSIWIRDGRIVEVLPGVAVPSPGARADVRVFDAGGKFAIPAFVDAHFHLLSLAHKGLRCDLSRASSAADVVAGLAAHVSRSGAPGDHAVVGVDFDESGWQEATLPTRAGLNGVAATRPVYARRVCCHVGVANDALLEALVPRLASPARFIDFETGRITEDAVFEANRLTRPADEAVVAAMDGALAHLHSLGITAIHDIVDLDTIDVYGAGLCASRRPLRIDAFLHTTTREYEAARARFDAIDPARRGQVRAVGIKIFADGSLGARTAALYAPYADADTTGELLVERRSLSEELALCAAQGIACAVHAIGDRALGTVLDAMGDARAKTGASGRFRVEHAEVMGEGELERIARLCVPLVMQPNFVRNWGGEGGLYEQRLGRARWERNNPFATLLQAGARVVFSSDGMPPGPLYGLKGATHHPVVRERIGAVDALRRYTVAASELGSSSLVAITAGAPADLVLLSGNPLFADVDGLRVEATFAEGREVYMATPPQSRRHAKPGP
jgi:predicted amidohydrolase YtcJ